MGKTFRNFDAVPARRGGGADPDLRASAPEPSDGRSTDPEGAPREHDEPSMPQLYSLVVSGQRVRLGRYEIVSCIGVGGMGVVYEAVNLERGHRVALKTLKHMSGSEL